MGRGSSEQNAGSWGCRKGGLGGGGSMNSGGGPGQSQSAPVSIPSMPHMVSRPGGGSSEYSGGLSIDLTGSLERRKNSFKNAYIRDRTMLFIISLIPLGSNWRR